jgi:hypothetical protein
MDLVISPAAIYIRVTSVIDANMTKSGQAKSKRAAVADAERAIDRAIAPKESTAP